MPAKSRCGRPCRKCASGWRYRRKNRIARRRSRRVGLREVPWWRNLRPFRRTEEAVLSSQFSVLSSQCKWGYRELEGAYYRTHAAARRILDRSACESLVRRGVQRARTEGPQRITRQGNEAVVMTARSNTTCWCASRISPKAWCSFSDNLRWSASIWIWSANGKTALSVSRKPDSPAPEGEILPSTLTLRLKA